MQSETVWDLLVIGGGTAGLVGAKTAARLGARVLLVERSRPGGECLWTGCVPSKALLAAADAAATARGSAHLGVHAEVRVDFEAVLRHVRSAIETIEPADSPASLRAVGVTVLTGTARLTGPATARVDGRDLRFRQALLATGATPTVPPIPGLGEVATRTSETIWTLDALPVRLAVLGGGSVGCELGQAFARLGSEVAIVEAEPRLLSREDPDASATLARALTRDGVRLHTGHRVARVEPLGGAAGRLVLSDGATVVFDQLLVAAGRTPRTGDLGLDTAGVEVDSRGFVVVDEHLRTANPNVWAAGDLTGHPQFTHVAGVHAALAASNAVLGLRRSTGRTGVARVTYTDPEVAAVGRDTGGSANGPRSLTLHHREVDRAVTEADTDGFTRLVLDRRGRIVGATVVGPRAGETLGELALAIRGGLRPRDLAATTHPYPTWNDGPWKAALADVRGQLERPVAARALGGAVRARRWWVDRRGR